MALSGEATVEPVEDCSGRRCRFVIRPLGYVGKSERLG